MWLWLEPAPNSHVPGLIPHRELSSSFIGGERRVRIVRLRSQYGASVALPRVLLLNRCCQEPDIPALARAYEKGGGSAVGRMDGVDSLFVKCRGGVVWPPTCGLRSVSLMKPAWA